MRFFSKIREGLTYLESMKTVSIRLVRVLWREQPILMFGRVILVVILALLPYLGAALVGRLTDALHAQTVSSYWIVAATLVCWYLYCALSRKAKLVDLNIETTLERYLAPTCASKREELGMEGWDLTEMRDRLKSAEDGEWRIRGFFSTQLGIARDLLETVVAAVVLFYYSPLVAALVSLGGAIAMVGELSAAYTLETLRQSQLESSRRLEWVRNIFRRDRSDIRNIRLVGMGERLRSLIVELLKPLHHESITTNRRVVALEVRCDIALYASIGVALYLLIGDVFSGQLSVGVVMFIVMSLLSFTATLSNLAETLGRQSVSVGTVTDLFSVLEEVKPSVVEPARPVSIALDGPPAVTFEAVDFRYPQPDSPLVLRNHTVEFPAGRMTWLVGSNGIGKSTMAALIGRLYDPTAGRVLIGGVDLRNSERRQRTKTLRILCQDVFKPLLTIYRSLQLGSVDGDIGEAEMREALAQAAALNFVNDCPEGLLTDLGPWNKARPEVSGGQWRKLHVAMIWVSVNQGSKVVILDEPTAWIDPPSSREIIKRMRTREGVTRIVATHQIDLIHPSEPVVYMRKTEEGRIETYQGLHQQLLSDVPSYRQYCHGDKKR